MPTPSTGGLLAFLLRAAPPAPDADADLLDRFVRHREEAAFAAIVRRHGPMVFGVCRRRLGAGPDAEDAFQATFLALARDAGKIARREALPGWLCRVAVLIALKSAGRRRGQAPPLAWGEVAGGEGPPEAVAQTRELRVVLDAELAALPGKLRAVAVLCLLEGRTNAEAGAVLGVPTGTVDSRLHAARKRLQARLVRRGAAAVAGVLMEQLAEGPAGAGFDALAARTVPLAAAFAAGVGPGSDAITSLANGVSTMTTTTRKVLAAAVLGAVLAAGTGFGVYRAAADPPGDEARKGKKADAAKPAAAELVAAVAGGKTASTTAVLNQSTKFTDAVQDISIGELFQQMSKDHDVTFRLDVGLLRTLGVQQPYDTKVSIPVVKGLSVRDVLQEVIDVLSPPGGGEVPARRLGVQVKGTQVIVTQAFVPPTAPGAYKTGAGEMQKFVSEADISNLLYGPTVAVAVADKPMAEVVALLREQTGANIVVDARVKDQIAAPVTLTLNDARLLTVLRVAGDMCEVAPAVVDNVFYLTTRDNADRLTKETERNLFGEPQVPIPAGYVTDGIHLYEKPAGLKPADPLKGLGGGLGGLGMPTTVPERLVKPAAPAKK